MAAAHRWTRTVGAFVPSCSALAADGRVKQFGKRMVDDHAKEIHTIHSQHGK